MNKKLIRLTESDLHKIVKESVKRILKESVFSNNEEYEYDYDEMYCQQNYKSFPLYTWSYSSIDGNTAFFYFLDKKNNKLIFIEYWLDEDTVAPYWKLYSVNGEVLDEEGFKLTKEQKKYFIERCRQEIDLQH